MKNLGLTAVIILFCTFSYGQVFENSGEKKDTVGNSGVMDAIRAPIDGAYIKIHQPQYKPIELTSIRQADVLWSQLVWSVIDLREKLNHSMYFPTEAKGNWKSLMQSILDATTIASEENPNPIRVYTDEYVTIPYTLEGIKENTSSSITTPEVNEWGEEIGQKTTVVTFRSHEVYQIIIKDQYLVDKQRSILEPRLITMCPMFSVESVNTFQSYNEDDDMQGASARRLRPFGWMYFPEMRQMFVVSEMFNPNNNAQRRTYDDIFMQRRFSSFIKAEENVKNNRQINEYFVNGMDQRLEADAIKEKIRYREHEMWEF